MVPNPVPSFAVGDSHSSRFALSALLATVFFLLLSAGAHAQTSPPPLMYQNPDTANTSGGFSFAALTVNQQTGALAPAAGSPFAATSSLQSMAIDPQGRFLYAVNPAANTVSMFSIDSTTGALSQVPGSPFSVAGTGLPEFVATDTSGKFLYVGAAACSNPSLGCVDIYTVDATNKTLVPPAQASLSLPGRVVGLASNPTFAALYVYIGPDNSGNYNAILQSYSINPTDGSLKLTVQSGQGEYGRILAKDAKSRYLVTGHGRFIGQVECWGLSPVDGSLSSFPSPAPAGQNTFATYAQGEFPDALTTDSTGNYLYVSTSHGLYIYSVNVQDGVLTAVSGSPFAAVGTVPAADIPLVADPQGPYLYSGGSSQIYAFQVDSQTGLLTQLSGSPFATNSTGGGSYLAFNMPSGAQPVSGPAISLFPASLQFAQTFVGSASSVQTTSIVSAGQQALSVNSISFTGTNPGDFSETDNCHVPTVLQPNTSCSVNVVFTPAATGTRSATLAVSDNASGSPQTVALSGTGLAPAPAVTLTSGSLAFPTTATGGSSTLTVTVTNSGQAPLSVAGATLSGSNTADFSVTNHCTAQVAVNTSCGIDVTFAPQAQGQRSAMLTIADNAGTQTVSLTGSGTAAFTLGAAANGSTSTAVTAGQTAQYNLQVTPGPGYTGTVTLACSGAPTAATCQASPASLSVSNGTAAGFTATVTTTGRMLVAPFSSPAPGLRMPLLAWLAAGFVLLLCWFVLNGSRKRPAIRALAFATLAFCMVLAGLAGCGGGSTASPAPQIVATPKGTTTITITATTTGAPPETLTLTLTVN